MAGGPPPVTGPPDRLIALQRSAGNIAVARMLDHAPPEGAPSFHGLVADTGESASKNGTGPADGPATAAAEQAAELIAADSSESEQQVDADAVARRQEIAARFGDVRSRIAGTLAGASAGVRSFLTSRQVEVEAAATTAIVGGRAMLTNTLQAAQAQVRLAGATVEGIGTAATARLDEQVTTVTGRFVGLVERMRLPDLPGVATIRSGATRLAGTAAGTVKAGTGHARSMISAALQQGTQLLGSLLSAGGQAASSALDRLATTVGRVLRSVVVGLNSLSTKVVRGLRSAVDRTVLPAVNRAESTAIGHLASARQHAITAIRDNRAQHVQALQAGDDTDVVAQAREVNASIATTFRERTGTILGSVYDAVAAAATAFSGSVSGLVGRIVNLVRAPIARLLDHLHQVRDAVGRFLQALLASIGAAVENVVGFIRPAVRDPIEAIARFALGAAGRVGEFYSGLALRLLRGNFGLPSSSELIGDPRSTGGPIEKPKPGPITLPDLPVILLLLWGVGALVVLFAPEFAAVVVGALALLGMTLPEVIVVVIIGIAAIVAIAVLLLLIYLLYRALKRRRPKTPRPAITHETHSPAPDGSPDTRKEVGVGEGVEFTGSAPGRWAASAGEPRTEEGDTFDWFTPPRRGTVTIRLAVGRRVATAKLKVVEPKRIAGSFREKLTFPRGEVGAGMKLDFELGPTNVFFGNLEHKEDATPAVAIRGYYRRIPEDELEHRESDTAWRDVGEDNRVGPDEASQHGEHLVPPHTDGSFHWKIPNRFRVGDKETGDESTFTEVTQEFGMKEGGRASVTKLGHHVERDPTEG